MSIFSELKSLWDMAKDMGLWEWLRRLNRRQKVAVAALLAVLLAAVFGVWAHFSGSFVPAVTQVTLNSDSLSLQTGDTASLVATVLYENNTTGGEVLWVSSNESVVQVDESGQLTALAAGTSTITAQASNRKSTVQAACTVTVADPLGGYAISVQRTAVENYVYIYVQPEDEGVQVTLYARGPSGTVFTPELNPVGLYHFFAETGTWTIYAALKSENSTYEAHKPEDFVTVEIADVAPDAMDALLAGLPVS